MGVEQKEIHNHVIPGHLLARAQSPSNKNYGNALKGKLIIYRE